VHLPFCAERCGYCSFNTGALHAGRLDRFLTALLRECDLARRGAVGGHVTLDTLFLGGGTPSLLDAEQMAHRARSHPRCASGFEPGRR